MLAERMLGQPILNDAEVQRLSRFNWRYNHPSDPLAFLRRPDYEEFKKAIQNDLAAQLKIVADSFDFYLLCGDVPAPAYADRVCVILRRIKRLDLERAFLAGWCRHFPDGRGQVYGTLLERARKIGALA